MFFGIGVRGALVGDMQTAGFTDVQERRIQAVLSFDNAARALSAVIDGGAVALAAKRFDAATRQAVDEQSLASIEAYRTGERYDIPGEFVVVSGRC